MEFGHMLVYFVIFIVGEKEKEKEKLTITLSWMRVWAVWPVNDDLWAQANYETAEEHNKKRGVAQLVMHVTRRIIENRHQLEDGKISS